MANVTWDAALVEREIEALLAEYPELAEDETLRADMLAGSTGAFEVLTAIVERMQDAKTMAEAVEVRIKELDQRLARYTYRAGAMRKLAERIMRAANLRKAELSNATLSIRTTPPSVLITDESEVPEAFFRVRREVNRQAVKEALKNGQFVPGAEISNGSETLSVRVA